MGRGERLGSRPEGRNWNVLGLGEVSAGVGGGALVPTGEFVCTWRTGRCWRGELGEEDVSDTPGDVGETGGEMGKASGTSGNAFFAAGGTSHLPKLLQRFLKSVLGVRGVGGRRSRNKTPDEES